MYLRPKIFLLGSSLAFSLKKDVRKCATKFGSYYSFCVFLAIHKVLFLKSVVMHLDIAARMGIKDAKAGAYQNHGLTMAKKIVMMVQMKKVLALFCIIALSMIYFSSKYSRK